MAITMSQLSDAIKVMKSGKRETVPCPCCGTECYVILREEVDSIMACKLPKKPGKGMKKGKK